MVGQSLCRVLAKAGYTNQLYADHSVLDLTCQSSVLSFFERHRPSVVIVAAGRVGGILANAIESAEFITENLSIALNVIEAAFKTKVSKLLYLGSSCIYPRAAETPIPESALLTGPLEETNQWYAVAKIAGVKLCQAYRSRYGANYFSVMPCNLLGPHDGYDLKRSHVIPALLRKFHEAKRIQSNEVLCWGTGQSKREFLYVDDLARACLILLENAIQSDIVNVGSGSETTIRDLAELIKQTVDFRGNIVWDKTNPDGTHSKLLDSSRMQCLGWQPRVTLRQGIKIAYEDFLRRGL